MNIPENLQYTKDHEWIKVDGDTAIIGITDFAQSELGDIVFVEVDTLDEEIAAGDVFGTIEAVKTVSDLFSPINGQVVEFNEEIESSPEVINNDPYGEGWIIKMKVEDIDSAELFDAAAYGELIGA